MQFTGTAAQQAFKQLLTSVFQLNESPNFYTITKPTPFGSSGWQFGVLQFDVLNYRTAYSVPGKRPFAGPGRQW